MTGKYPNTEDFKKEIVFQITEAKARGLSSIELVSGDIHRKLGGYPNNRSHQMPSCCKAMRDTMQPGDQIISGPDKGNGASLKIRYHT